MAACTFFGHHDCPSSIRSALMSTLTDLIENHAVDTFYVGRQGAFDSLARSVLRQLSAIYPHIRYWVVLERLPAPAAAACPQEDGETLFPEGLESVPRRFAISHRNRWMLSRADYVVTYITHHWGGAAQYAALAEKQHKHILPLFLE